jgi:Tol biopolymer transport system component
MKRFDDSKIMLLLLAFVLTLMLAATSANADFIFGNLQNLGPVINSSSGDAGICFSADSLELYFSSDRPGGYGYYDIWMTTRVTKSDPWGLPLNLGPAVNTPYAELCPSISSDGLTLYFSDDWMGSARPGGLGGYDIWMARRASRGAPWGTPVNVGAPINSTANDLTPTISGDGLIFVFASTRAGGKGSYDLWMSTRATIQDDWGAPVNIGGVVNNGSFDAEPSLSSDDRALVFSSRRPGGFGDIDLWMTTRKTHSDPWGPPANLGPGINSWGHEGGAAISADARMLYFYTHTPPGNFGSYDLWEAPIIPLVDFNGNKTVDMKDFSRLAQYWGQNESSVDIGPNPWGDGTVDIQDMAVLAEYWLREVLPVELIAYWKLDETEGVIADESIHNNDGDLHGNPIWQPAAGKVNGALELDGIDDYVSTAFILDPAAGAFSVFAWIKAGTPGQVIVSQAAGANWLSASPAEGKLMTELMAAGRFGRALISGVVITDGEWHHIGLVWDGSYRTLYVDEIEAAKDAQPQSQPISANGGLYIGTGKGRETGSFWSGLIDDIKIYDRALTP